MEPAKGTININNMKISYWGNLLAGTSTFNGRKSRVYLKSNDKTLEISFDGKEVVFNQTVECIVKQKDKWVIRDGIFNGQKFQIITR